MGSSSLIYIMGALMAFAIMNNAIINITSEQSTSSMSRYSSCQSRNSTNGVVSMLASKVSSDMTFRSTNYSTINLLNGTAQYRVIDTLVSPDTLIKIQVIGIFNGDTTVASAYFLKPTTTATVPTAFKYALASQGNCNLAGNVSILPDAANPTTNANVQVNGNVSLTGNPSIKGFLTYGGTFAGSTSKITPVSNPSGSPVAVQVSPVAIPTFNPDDYKAKATTVYTGSFSITGTFSLGTKANPAIIYVGGDFSMSGNTTISGYGIVIVKGNVQMSGNTTFNTLDPGSSTFGCYAAGDIQLSGNSDFYGQMLSLKNIQLNGNVNIHGTAAANQEVQMNGNNKIYYKPASASLTSPVFTSGVIASGRLNLKQYYE